MEDHLVANEEAIEIPVENDGRVERFGKDGRYPKRERRPPGEWWKNHILPQHGEERANVALLDDPLNLCEALRSEDASKWEAAMQEEYDSLMANSTWELTNLPKDRKSVGCKWVFRTKNDALGEIVRYKARLVAKGYSQVARVDFNETFAPVAKFITIRCILALGAAMDWEIHQMDVKTTFLNGILEVEIYMDQPEDFVQEGKKILCANSRKLCTGSSNRRGRGTTVLTRSSSTRVFVGAKRIIRCTSNKRVNICWWQSSMWMI